MISMLGQGDQGGQGIKKLLGAEKRGDLAAQQRIFLSRFFPTLTTLTTLTKPVSIRFFLESLTLTNGDFTLTNPDQRGFVCISD